MLLIYIGIYTLFLVAIWSLFILARIHALKFQKFSTAIPKVTNLLLIALVVLSLLGYIMIFLSSSPRENTLDGFEVPNETKVETRTFDSFDENYY
jgi:antibiotic biosynthesis monooxygenase (ABM) superfamily enzyme